MSHVLVNMQLLVNRKSFGQLEIILFLQIIENQSCLYGKGEDVCCFIFYQCDVLLHLIASTQYMQKQGNDISHEHEKAE